MGNQIQSKYLNNKKGDKMLGRVLKVEPNLYNPLAQQQEISVSK